MRILKHFLYFSSTKNCGVVYESNVMFQSHILGFADLGFGRACYGFAFKYNATYACLSILGSIMQLLHHYMFGKRDTSQAKQKLQVPPGDKPTPLPFKSSTFGVQNKVQVSSSGTNLVENNYSFTIMDPVDESDPTIAAMITISPLPGQKKRFLDIQSFFTFLLNYGGTDFPSGVELVCPELTGFYNKDGMATNVISVTRPTQISSVQNAGGIQGYNVIYQSTAGVIWDVTNINTLTFRIRLSGETEARPLPSAQPLSLEIKISHVIF